MKKRVNRSKVRVLLDEMNNYPDSLDQYLESAVCFSFPELRVLIDGGDYYPEFTKKCQEIADKDLRSFIIRAGKNLGDCDLDTVAHNFLMARNRCSGFWNKYPKVVADKLDRICKRFSKVEIYKNEEGYYEQTRRGI